MSKGLRKLLMMITKKILLSAYFQSYDHFSKKLPKGDIEISHSFRSIVNKICPNPNVSRLNFNFYSPNCIKKTPKSIIFINLNFRKLYQN